jgi:hypothetical protein
MANDGINLRITKGIKGGHHPARPALPDRDPQKLIINAVQEGRQRQWHTHPSATGFTVAGRAMHRVESITLWGGKHHHGTHH